MFKFKKIFLCLCLLFISGCTTKKNSGDIYLYGERHDKALIKQEELKIWKEYYDQGMRHLFIEKPYYTAMFLNEWMQAKDDEILNYLQVEWGSSFAASKDSINFYKSIKKECPETIFHGTDVGHQYNTTGKRYLNKLLAEGKKDSIEYQETLTCIQQGKEYYSTNDLNVREQMMVDNFIKEYDKLNGEDVMGIYGSAHIIDCGNLAEGVDFMGKVLANTYAQEKVHLIDLTPYGFLNEPIKQVTITYQNQEYLANYYGEEEIKDNDTYKLRRYYHLIDAYELFKDYEKSGDCYPLQDFIMTTKQQEAYLFEYVLKNNEIESIIYITEGAMWEGMEVAEAIK